MWVLTGNTGPKLSLRPEAAGWLALPGLGWAWLYRSYLHSSFFKTSLLYPAGDASNGKGRHGETRRRGGGPRACRANAASEMETLGGLTSSQADWAHSSYGQDESRPAPGRVAVTILRVCRHMVRAFCYFMATDNQITCAMLKCDVRHAHPSIHSEMPWFCKLTVLKNAPPLLAVYAGNQATDS